MNQKQITENAKIFIRDLFLNEATGHDEEHSLRVYKTALEINEKEHGDEFIISLASLLHDVDDYKLFPENRNYENARRFMNENSMDEKTQERIIHIISQVSFKGKDSEKPDSLEGMIVQDADRLDAIGAIGIARCFAYGGSKGRKIYDRNDKPDPDKSYEEYRNGTLSSLSHFYEKLLLLKDMMNTEEGKRIAEHRHKFMEEYLDEFYQEIGA